MPVLTQTEAHHVGPTVNTNAELAVPVFRQEAHEIVAASAPINLQAAKPRPLTHKMNHSLMAAPAIALTRSANDNPAAAGEGDQTSMWGASGALGEAAGEGVGRMVPMLLIGAAVGVALAAMR